MLVLKKKNRLLIMYFAAYFQFLFLGTHIAWLFFVMLEVTDTLNTIIDWFAK